MRPLAPLVDSLLQDLRTGVKEKRSDLQSLWPEIAGPTFTPHTKPTLGREGLLCVWVDSGVLASELAQRYQGTLLKRTQEALGEEAVKEIKFRVGQIR
jgi:predicted nucleic acid-binding Zn ribbon protein